jgi:hypothetical protein
MTEAEAAATGALLRDGALMLGAALFLGRGMIPAEEVERRISLRINRQEVLTRPEPVRVWAVIDEAALRRPIGGGKVIIDQLNHLIEISHMPNVTLQVVPLSIGGHAAAGGSFSILRFPESDLPDTVYIEHLTSALYLDKLDELDQYTAAMESLCVAAPQPNKTRDILAGIRKDFER